MMMMMMMMMVTMMMMTTMMMMVMVLVMLISSLLFPRTVVRELQAEEVKRAGEGRARRWRMVNVKCTVVHVGHVHMKGDGGWYIMYMCEERSSSARVEKAGRGTRPLLTYTARITSLLAALPIIPHLHHAGQDYITSNDLLQGFYRTYYIV